MDSFLEPLLAILAIFIPIWLVYGLLALEEQMRNRKRPAANSHFDRGGKTTPCKTGQ
jgi:hypothetical protein